MEDWEGRARHNKKQKQNLITLLNIKIFMLDVLFPVLLHPLYILQENICRIQITTDDATDSSVFKRRL